MAKQPLVTVVTPSYNQGQFIEETINSVLSQDYPNLEYLVFDGGSTDNTLEILKKYKERLTFVSEADKGQSDAVNKGFRVAKGEIIGWLNSDDTYQPDAIRTVVDYYGDNPDILMVYGKGAHVDKNGCFMEWYPTEPFSLQRLAETCFICQPAVFLRADVFKKIGLLDEKLNYCMDYEYWIRIAKSCKVGYLPKHLANTRLYQDTKTLSQRIKVHTEIIKSSKKHFGFASPIWISAYSHYVLDKFLTRETKIKDITYVNLLIMLVIINNLRFNYSLKTPGLRDLIAGLVGHLKFRLKN